MPADDRGEQKPILARVLKRLRELRGLQVADLAARMGLPKRTYEDFEAGRRKLRVERVRLAAEALDVDLYAIFMAMEFGSPEFAVRCADNKMATIVMIETEQFDAGALNAIRHLDPQTISSVLNRAFGELTRIAIARDGITGGWPRGPKGPRGPRGPKGRGGGRS